MVPLHLTFMAKALLQQIQQQFGGATAFSQFKNFLDQPEIT